VLPQNEFEARLQKNFIYQRCVILIIETMLRLFVRMPTGEVPMVERFYWGKVAMGVAPKM
jgi:hypothetical protein